MKGRIFHSIKKHQKFSDTTATHGLARKDVKTCEKARIYKAFLYIGVTPKPWVAGSNPPPLTFFFSVLSRDTISVWYSIKKVSK